MSASDPILFPCPRCGTGRGTANAVCRNCGWGPDFKVASSLVAQPKAEANFKTYSKFSATVIGFLTFLPFAWQLFSLVVFSQIMFGGSPPPDFLFKYWFAGHVALTLVVFGLLAFYIYYLFKTDHVRQDKKALWAVVLFLANVLAMPFFWYYYILKPAENRI